jgi:hypothetical protein
MIRTVVRHSVRENDLMFASALLPILALSENPSVSASALDVSRELRDRRREYSSYRFQREMYRGAAEAGDVKELIKGVEFIARHGASSQEAKFLDRYGWTEDVRPLNLRRKLENPAQRDKIRTSMSGTV